MRKTSTVGTLGLLILLLAFASCALPNMPEFTAIERTGLSSVSGEGITGAVAYRRGNDSVTLQWDAAPGTVSAYRVYARDRSIGEWTRIEEIPASQAPSYEVTRAALGDGSYDFAVSSVNDAGEESVKHTSLDPDADPPSGWFVIWESSP